MSRSTAIVFGSINIDLVARTPHLPKPGETLLGHSFVTVPGGKGANQAVAVSRLGVPTVMVGRVGGDSFGQTLLASLQAANVDTANVLTDEASHSGVAMIAVDDRSENHIIVIPGANGQVSQEDVARLIDRLPNAVALLLQLEVPLVAVQSAAEAAHKAGVRVILDPAPAHQDISLDLYPLIDIMTPNAVEAEQLVGFPVTDAQTADRAASVLQQRGVNTVVIKLGAMGVFYATRDDRAFVPAFEVKAVDTVAAGDAFNGGMAAALVEQRSISEAVWWGAAAGALSATKPGAQSSLPDRSTFDQFLRERLHS